MGVHRRRGHAVAEEEVKQDRLRVTERSPPRQTAAHNPASCKNNDHAEAEENRNRRRLKSVDGPSLSTLAGGNYRYRNRR